MWKALLAGTTALAIAGATLAYAQQRTGRAEGRWQPSAQDMRAFADARLAALRAGLSLTPEQEKYWPAFEKAARALQKLRIDRIQARIVARRKARDDDQARRRDPVERLRRRATRMSETGAVLKEFADAMAPLYASLDDAQKRRFAVLNRMTGPRFQRGPHRRGPNAGPRRGWHRFDGPPNTDRDRRRTEALPGPKHPGTPRFERMSTGEVH